MKLLLVTFCACVYLTKAGVIKTLDEIYKDVKGYGEPVPDEALEYFTKQVKLIEGIGSQAKTDLINAGTQLKPNFAAYVYFTRLVYEQFSNDMNARNKVLTTADVETFFNRIRSNKKYSTQDIEDMVNQAKQLENDVEKVLKEKLTPEELIRVMSFMKIMWGSKDEIDTGLAYVYGNAA